MRIKKRLGELLVENGIVTEQKVEKALSKQAGKLKIGHVLIREGLVTEIQIVEALANQLKLERYTSDNYSVDSRLKNIISPAMAEKYHVIPLSRHGQLLVVAMTDPMDINILDTIEAASSCEVEPVICTEKEFNQLFLELYGKISVLGSVIEELGNIEFGQGIDEESSRSDIEVSSLEDMAEDAPIIRIVNSIIAQAIKEGSSDIHFSPERDSFQIRFRIDGKLVDVPAPPLSTYLPIVSRLKILSNLDISVSRAPQDGRFTAKVNNREIHVRTSTIPTIYGENVVLRLLDISSGILSLQELGMSEENRQKLETAIRKPYGMILCSGPTGSGKSTSLFSMLSSINTPDVNIITVEDPVEYRLDNIRQLQLNRKAGMTFAGGLRSILRQDPDIIMVGEIRDAETANLAVQAALTGHRVFSTIHTNDAIGVITRFIDMGVASYLVASVLLVSIGQRLLRKVCPNCREIVPASPAAMEFFNIEPSRSFDFVHGRGCHQCMMTGYKNRVGIYEVLAVTDTIQEMITHGSSSYEISRAMQATGKYETLKQSALNLMISGVTSQAEAMSAVMM